MSENYIFIPTITPIMTILKRNCKHCHTKYKVEKSKKNVENVIYIYALTVVDIVFLFIMTLSNITIFMCISVRNYYLCWH